MEAKRPLLRDILAGENLIQGGADGGMSMAEIAKALAPASGLSAGAFQAVLTVGQSLGQRLGLGSSKQMERTFAIPYPVLVRALVLALGSRRYAITALFDTPKGAFVEAQLPKDLFSLGGTLRFDVVEEGADAVRLVAVSEIKGQMFDWGKGAQAVNDVLGTTELFASRLKP